MAGHSKFANIKHRKGAQDAKRAKVFTKLVREIIVAAKAGGPDPDGNSRLRAAIAAARALNVPKDRIEAAINKGHGSGDGSNFDEIRYEGYGPGGIAIIVDALTDNKNRTASDIRSTFTKNGGALGETGSVSFMFDRIGLIIYGANVVNKDQIFEQVIEAGADDYQLEEDSCQIICKPDLLNEVREYLSNIYGDPEVCRLSWQPQNFIEVSDPEKQEKILKLVDVLEDNDDVQYVTGNYMLES
jgi:YebC/PmpR family DNA-binding regulatory protein